MMRNRRERLARIAQGYSDNDRIILDAREWLLDAFGHDEDAADYIEDMSVLEVVLSVERHYAGGWEHFVETATCPFTAEELDDAAAELDEETAAESSPLGAMWLAYCTTCRGALESARDRRIVESAALTHVNRCHGHQVIVGKEILGRDYGVCVAP